MTTDKPSRNEDEYFAKLEMERLERKRLETQKRSEDQERQSHYMRCPKCGGHLKTEDFHKIQIDRCSDCSGVWLDAGEIDAVVDLETRGFMGRALGDFMGSLKGKKK